jgi:N-acetylneuraminic acid mutarotase
MKSKKKNKDQKKEKQQAKQEKKRQVEDIDAILESFKKEQEQLYTVVEELNCPPPSKRANCSLNVNPLTNELLLFGGEYYDGKVHIYNDFYKYNIDKNEWKRIVSPNSPGPRSSHQIVITPSGLLFLWGGEFTSPNETNFFHYKDFWMMDLRGNSWERIELKQRPPPRSGHRMVLWKQYIVMFGGFYDQIHETKYYDDLWLFDTTEFTWHQVITDIKPTARSGFQFMAHGDSILLYGGYSKTKKSFGIMHTDAWLLKMSLDPKSIRWEKRKKCGGISPGPRSGCTVVYHKGKGNIFGGVSDLKEDEETIESICHDDMFQYVIDSNKWYPIEKKAIQPMPRFNPAMAVVKNVLYMFGGILEVQNKEATFQDFWSLNLDKLQEWNCIIKDDSVNLAGEESDSDSDSVEGSEVDMDVDEVEEVQQVEQEVQEVSNQITELTTEEKPMTIEQKRNQSQNDPIPGESMSDYFTRTATYWESQAMSIHEFRTQKGMRRKAFNLANERFLELEPENRVLAEQMKEYEDVMAKKKESIGESRHRR